MKWKDVVDELGLQDQVAAVKTLEDWGAVLEAVKEAKPDMTPFVSNSGNTAAVFQYGLWDDLGNNYGVLMKRCLLSAARSLQTPGLRKPGMGGHRERAS